MEMIVAIGLQASGKSSFCRQFASTHAIVSKDLFPNARNPQRRQMREISAALGAGSSVVVDNTNASREDRQPVIAAARAAGASVTGYYFQSRIDWSLERNGRREGRARVPRIAILSTAKRLQMPSYEEGFDRLFFVRMEDHGFVVEKWLTEYSPR